MKQLPQVQAAIGGVAGIANLIGQNGKVISFGGAPHLGFSVDPTQAKFNSLTLVEGEWPATARSSSTARPRGKKHIEVGDRIRIEAQGAREPFKVAGLVRFGSSGLDIGGATLSGFNLLTAQRLFKKEGKLDQIRVSRKANVSEAALLASIRSILPQQTQVRSGVEPGGRPTRATRTPSRASCRRSCSRSASSHSSSARS